MRSSTSAARRIRGPAIHRIMGAVLLVGLLAVCAWAGPNATGVLIVHESGLWYSHIYDYCGYGEIPETCEDADTRVDDPYIRRVWKIYAAFAEGSSPVLKGITFGVEYPYENYEIELIAWGPCAEFELSEEDWPLPGTGNSLVWNDPQTDILVEVYWFAGYDYYGIPALFGTAPHPQGGGWFADDSIPAILDEIVDYGALGFLMDGYLPCPPPVGACCLEDGSCVVTSESDCAGQGGGFEGIGVPCDPDPCQPITVEAMNWGRVKARYR